MDCEYCYYLNVCHYGRCLVCNEEFMNFYRTEHKIPPPTGIFPGENEPITEPIIPPKKKYITPKGAIATPYGPITLPPGFVEPLNES